MENFITRKEHEEFAKRIDMEDHRLSKRISEVAEDVKKITDLTVSVNNLASSMKQMLEEQQKQGERLEKLEEVPIKNWSTLKTAVLTAIGTAIGTGIVTTIINNLMN